MASVAIAVFGFLVWGHHMFVSTQSIYAGMIFSFLSYAVAIPSAVKVFNWTATLYKGSISLQTPMLYALGFIGLFTLGGLTGLFLASISVDVHVTDTIRSRPGLRSGAIDLVKFSAAGDQRLNPIAGLSKACRAARSSS